jgi:hypothetical protein
VHWDAAAAARFDGRGNENTMTNLKIVALAAFVALPVACSRDRRDTESPEGMTPASGYSEPVPSNPTAPGPMQDPMAPAAPDDTDTSDLPGSGTRSGPIEREAEDTIGASDTDADATATGGTGTGGRGGSTSGGSTSGGSTGGTGKGRGGSSTGGTNTRDGGM